MTGKRIDAAALTFAIALALAACGGEAEPAQTAQMGPGAERTPVVEIHEVARGSIARQVTVTGTVDPLRLIGVNAQLPGALTAVNVQEGDMVRAGAVLARVDDRDISSQLAAAEASFEVAEAAYERARQLRERRVITLPEYERDRTAYAAAKAQVEQLRTRLGYTTVNAPATGVITEKLVETGDVVGNQTRLFTIADVSQLVVRLGVSELDVVQLAAGDPVAVTLDALPNRQLAGRIRRIFPMGDPTTRLVPVEVVLDPQSAQAARPGFLARITFDLTTSNNVLLVPVSAVLGGQGSQAVFVVENNTAIRRTVSTGLTSEGRVEVVSGLSDGEHVVITGHNELRDGMTVRAVGGPAEVPTQSSTGSPAAAEAPAGAQAVEPAAAAPAPR
ncbi:MAG TPA: efflux RND transporter periplasmic adaptor subunit [Longimicrobiales bacterium]|nr:efflux RND transporter periplasmic adaptor subunit [Longimicrobiales bacterium]